MASKWFTSEKLPYLLTILFSFVGWGTTHVVDRMTNTPLLEYSVTKENNNTTTKLTYCIKNIVLDKKFDDLNILFQTSDSANNGILKGTFFIPAPMKMDNENDEVTENYPHEYSLKLKTLQPHTELKIEIIKKGESVIPLRLESKSIVRVTGPTFQTFIINNEFSIILVLIVLWVAAIFSYMYFIKI